MEDKDGGAGWPRLFALCTCVTALALGAKITIEGPTQLYIARNVGSSIAEINFAYSSGAVGALMGALLSGFVFKSYFKSGPAKSLFMVALMVLVFALQLVTPFVRSFPVLLVVKALQAATRGAYFTVTGSTLVYTMGPVKSRPFINATHTFFGIGFWLGTLAVRPFLPAVETEESLVKHMQEICQVDDKGEAGGGAEIGEPAEVVDDTEWLGLERVFWPYVVTSIFGFVASVGYLLLVFCPWKMPRFEEECKPGELPGDKKDLNNWVALLFGVFMFYLISCGMERIYQPMAYTFGLCGPLGLSPAEAVITDTTYNGGFMLGRIVSIPIVKVIKPRDLVLASISGCVLASVVLCFLGGTEKYGLYISTGVLGFFLSWQYGCCYSWVSKKLDVTGRLASVFSLGAVTGGAAFAPASGYLFKYVGPTSLLYFTLAAASSLATNFALMMWFGQEKVKKVQQSTKL